MPQKVGDGGAGPGPIPPQRPASQSRLANPLDEPVHAGAQASGSVRREFHGGSRIRYNSHIAQVRTHFASSSAVMNAS